VQFRGQIYIFYYVFEERFVSVAGKAVKICTLSLHRREKEMKKLSKYSI